ncbi:MAG: hypothetical protein K2Z81_11730 [Cyanobacteria bacterium]|nr:hypothetical protein [Cyanobacteriota bacterium]
MSSGLRKDIFKVQSRSFSAVLLTSMLATISSPAIAKTGAEEPELIPPIVHWAKVSGISVSPDGRTFASCSNDWTVKLWDSKSNRLLRTYSLPPYEPLESVSFSADGKTLLGGVQGMANALKLWDVNSGKSLQNLDVEFVEAAFSPDGKSIATSTMDGTLKFYNAATGKLERTVDIDKIISKLSLPPKEGEKAKHYGALDLAFSQDGKTLAVAGNHGVYLWDASGKYSKTISKTERCAQHILYSPDGKLIATSNDNGSVDLWNASSDELIRTFKEHQDEVFSLAFSSDSKILATASADNTIKLCDVAAGSVVRTISTEKPCTIAFSSDGTRLYSGNAEAIIRVWNPSTGEEMQVIKDHSSAIRAIALTSDGKMLATASGTNVELWDLSAGKVIACLTGESGAVPINFVCFSPDGKNLVSCNAGDGAIAFWDIGTGKKARDLTGADPSSIYFMRMAAFSPDSKTMALAHSTGIDLQESATGKPLAKLEDPLPADYVAFSPDGKILAGCAENKICLWDTDSGKKTMTFSDTPEKISSVAFSPDGKLLVSSSNDNVINLWDVATGKKVLSITGGATAGGAAGGILSFAFTPDGTKIAVIEGNAVVLRETSSGKKLQTLDGHSNTVTAVAFTPDGKTLASSSLDSSLKLWSLDTGKEIATLYSCDATDWVVVMKSGCFDASPAAMKLFHWRLAYNCTDLIDLKDQFYEENLLSKLLNHQDVHSVPDLGQELAKHQ